MYVCMYVCILFIFCTETYIEPLNETYKSLYAFFLQEAASKKSVENESNAGSEKAE